MCEVQRQCLLMLLTPGADSHGAAARKQELCKSILVFVRQRRREFREIAHLPRGSPACCHRTGLCELLLFSVLVCMLGEVMLHLPCEDDIQRPASSCSDFSSSASEPG